MARRLTYGKRFAAFGGSGYAKMQSGLRPLCIFAPPHFCGCWNCFAIPSSQPQKRRLPVHVVRHAQIDMRGNIYYIYGLKKEEECAFGAIGNLCVLMLCAYGAVDRLILAF